MRRLLVCTLALSACHASLPTGPTVVPQATVLTLQGLDGAPISGAQVRVQGAPSFILSDAQGRAGLAGPPYSSPSAPLTVTVAAPGYLFRTLYVTKSRTDVLWRDGGLWASTIFPLAYGSQGYFFIPKGPIVTVALDPSVTDPRAPGALAAAVATINQVDPALQFVVTTGKANVTVSVNPALGYGGALSYFDSFDADGYLLTGRIVFQGTQGFWGDYLQSALLHELGHQWGLEDVPASSTVFVMSRHATHAGGPALQFSPQEQNCMRMMLRRRPGNQPVDQEKP